MAFLHCPSRMTSRDALKSHLLQDGILFNNDLGDRASESSLPLLSHTAPQGVVGQCSNTHVRCNTESARHTWQLEWDSDTNTLCCGAGLMQCSCLCLHTLAYLRQATRGGGDHTHLGVSWWAAPRRWCVPGETHSRSPSYPQILSPHRAGRSPPCSGPQGQIWSAGCGSVQTVSFGHGKFLLGFEFSLTCWIKWNEILQLLPEQLFLFLIKLKLLDDEKCTGEYKSYLNTKSFC